MRLNNVIMDLLLCYWFCCRGRVSIL